MNIKLTLIILVSLCALVFAACQTAATKSTSNNQTVSYQTDDKPAKAFERLFAAVKSQNTDQIKNEMSQQTIAFAEGMAGMRSISTAEMLKNGLLDATTTDAFPALRDERVKDNFAAVEVQNPNGTWQDVPLVLENGVWKIAIGELWQNTYKSPGAPASRANQPPMMPPAENAANPTTNQNFPIGIANSGDGQKAPEKSGKKSQANSR